MKQKIEELLIKNDPKNKEKLDQLKKMFEYDEKKQICSLCGKEMKDYGNSTYPVCEDDEKCCDECNVNVVLPVRFNVMYGSKRKTTTLLQDGKKYVLSDGECIKVRYNNGSEQDYGEFRIVDPHHFDANGTSYHKSQFIQSKLKDGYIVKIYRKDGDIDG